MRFYDRKSEISILRENESQSKQSAVFTVLMGRKPSEKINPTIQIVCIL